MHSSLLELLEGLSSLDCLMLARVTDQQDTILVPDTSQKVPHLSG
jgi:hypothetical protein